MINSTRSLFVGILLLSGILFAGVNSAQASICDVSGKWTIHQDDGSLVNAQIIKKSENSNNSELIGNASFKKQIGNVSSGFIHDRKIMIIITWQKSHHQGKYDGGVNRKTNHIDGTMFDLTTASPRQGFVTDQTFRCR